MKTSSTFVPGEFLKVEQCIHCSKRCMTYLKCGRRTWKVFMFPCLCDNDIHSSEMGRLHPAWCIVILSHTFYTLWSHAQLFLFSQCDKCGIVDLAEEMFNDHQERLFTSLWFFSLFFFFK